jgi:phospholipase/carboxylesterase
MFMHQKNVIKAGVSIDKASRALVMLHGRGATAQDILSLSGYLNVAGYALLAPQATNHTWYPYSFLAPVGQNEPWLTSAVDVVKSIVADVEAQGIASENIFILGFSQGACLTLEFAARNAKRYGGLVAFTGGLIGHSIDASRYSGDFAGTPVFLGTSNPDMHVPVERVHASAGQLRSMNAEVTEKVYNGMGHTISEDEIREVNDLIFQQVKTMNP